MNHWISSIPQRDRIILAVLLSVSLDVLVVQPIEQLTFHTTMYVPLWMASLWFSLPRLLFFAFSGFVLVTHLCASKIQSLVYLLCIAVYQGVYVQNRFDISVTLWGLSTTVVHYAVIPLGFAVGCFASFAKEMADEE